MIELDSRGTVLTHTVLHHPPEGFDAPLTLALVSLQHEAVVLCLNQNVDGVSTEIGDEVSIVIGDGERFHYSLSKGQ
jgi:uncharacterized OB-fold protein